MMFHNDGGEIVRTTYWDTTQARALGLFFLSFHRGTFRLLVPDSKVRLVEEMRTGREAIVSSGPFLGQEGVEIMFEDGSDAPYAIQMQERDFDCLPGRANQDRPGEGARWVLAVWTRAGKVLELPCRFRVVSSLPCLRRF